MELTDTNMRKGLNKILAEYASGINNLKEGVKQKYIADPNYWKRRPLEADAIRYAAEDVAHLLEVEREMSSRLGTVQRKEVLVRSRQAADSQRCQRLSDLTVEGGEDICEAGLSFSYLLCF